MRKHIHLFLSIPLLGTLSCTPVSSSSPTPVLSPIAQPSASGPPAPTSTPKPTPAPTNPQEPDPLPSDAPLPEPLPSASPPQYQVLSRYPIPAQDQSIMMDGTDHTKAAVMSWVNDNNSVLYGIFPEQIHPTPLRISAGVSGDVEGKVQIQTFSQKANQQGLYIRTIQSSSDFDLYARKTSAFTRILNNEFQWNLPLDDYVAYGLAVNTDGNGWLMVSNEKQQTYPPLPNPPNTTLVGRIPVSQWQPAEKATLEPILELPLFFQHENIIKHIEIDAQGNGLILVSAPQNKLTLHQVRNFTAVSSQEVAVVPPSNKAPRLVLKHDAGHIDWRNGQFTRIENLRLKDHLKLTAGENRDYFLDASGNGYQIDRLPAAVHWQKIENYIASAPEATLRFTTGTRVDAVTINLSQSDRPLLMGMNHTCEARDTCENKGLTTREVWLKNLTESPIP